MWRSELGVHLDLLDKCRENNFSVWEKHFQNPGLNSLLYCGDCLSTADLPWMNQSIWLWVDVGEKKRRRGGKKRKGGRRLWAIWAGEARGWFIIRVDVCSIPPLLWRLIHRIKRQLCCCELVWNQKHHTSSSVSRWSGKVRTGFHLSDESDCLWDVTYPTTKMCLKQIGYPTWKHQNYKLRVGDCCHLNWAESWQDRKVPYWPQKWQFINGAWTINPYEEEKDWPISQMTAEKFPHVSKG